MEPLVLRYQLDAGEFAAAAFDHCPAIRSIAVRGRALGIAAIALGALLLANSSASMALLAVGVLIFGLHTRFSIIHRNRSVYQRTPFFTDEVAVVADPEGARFTTADSEMWYRWSTFAAAGNTVTGVALVMRGGTTLRWIPSRAFEDADQQAAWFAQAQAGIDGARAADHS